MSVATYRTRVRQRSQASNFMGFSMTKEFLVRYTCTCATAVGGVDDLVVVGAGKYILLLLLLLLLVLLLLLLLPLLLMTMMLLIMMRMTMIG